MKTKSRFVALIIASCLVIAGSVGLIAWAIAAANVGIGSKLSVTYEAAPHVVCTADATYQKTTDATATPFQSGTINMNYGDASGSYTLNASNTALVLNDTNTYVVFEFTFTNNNKMNTMGINITLTDNGLNNNMIRKYYFGDLSSKTISEKESTIKSSGIENSALSTKSVTLKQNQTTRIYMLLEITPGVKANYNSDSTNKFLFTLTSVEVDPNATVVSYLSPKWKSRLMELCPDGTPCGETFIEFVKDKPELPSGTKSCSVGTNRILGFLQDEAYVESSSVSDITAYIFGHEDGLKIVIYSPYPIIFPNECRDLLSYNDFVTPSYWLIGNIHYKLNNIDTSKVENFGRMFYVDTESGYAYNNGDKACVEIDLSEFNTSSATDMGYMFAGNKYLDNLDLSSFDTSNVQAMNGMFGECESLSSIDLGNFNLQSCVEGETEYMFLGCSSLATITLPYNVPNGVVIELPATFVDAAGTEYTQIDSTNCSTATNKVTLTKYSSVSGGGHSGTGQ